MSNVSISGPRSRSAWTISAPNARLPRIAASIVTNARPRSGSGISGIGGICMIRAAEVTSSGTVCGPLAPGVQHLGRALPRPPHRARVELGDRVQRDLHRRHDAEAAAAAAQRPEQVRVVVGVDAAQAPVGGHDLDREHAVGGQAVLAREPADAAAEACSRRRRRPARSPPAGRAVLGRRRGDLEPQRAGGDAGAAGDGVDATPRIRAVLSSTVSSSDPSGPALWPVPWGATRRPFRRAYSTIATTSSAFSGNATSAGRWSTARFQAWRAWSQAASAGPTTSPRMRVKRSWASRRARSLICIFRSPGEAGRGGGTILLDCVQHRIGGIPRRD